MNNTYKMQTTPEEAFLLQALRERERKFEDKRACDFYTSGVIDGFHLYREYTETLKAGGNPTSE